MEKTDNYQIQARQAQARFLTYDQEALLRKLRLESDEAYIYLSMLSQPYRIDRKTGSMQKLSDGRWADSNSHGEVMTLLDLLCDSREDRFLTHKWKAMTSFGLMFHQNLLEGKQDPLADFFEENAEAFRRVCIALGGKPFPQGDIAYSIELFDGLEILVQLWFGDEEFPAGLRLLWDENALMYIKYETMYFARGILMSRIRELMKA